MRFTIDTKLERIIVSNGFFNEIDKMNKVLEEHSPGAEKIDYVKFVNEEIEKAKKNPLIRRADLKSLSK